MDPDRGRMGAGAGVAQVREVSGAGLHDQCVALDWDAQRDDVLDVAEPETLGVTDDARCGVDEASGLVTGRGDDRQDAAGGQHPPCRCDEQPELFAGEHPQVGPACRAARGCAAPGVVPAGLVGRRGAYDQGDLSEVVRQAFGHLVGPDGTHLHSRQVPLVQGGAEPGADVLGEWEVRDQRDGAAVEFGGGDQGGFTGGEAFGDQCPVAGAGTDQVLSQFPPDGLAVLNADCGTGLVSVRAGARSGRPFYAARVRAQPDGQRDHAALTGGRVVAAGWVVRAGRRVVHVLGDPRRPPDPRALIKHRRRARFSRSAAS